MAGAAEDLALEILSKQAEMLKKSDDAIAGVVRDLGFAVAFDIFLWTQLSRDHSIACPTVNFAVFLLLLIIVLGIVASSLCAYRQIIQNSIGAEHLRRSLTRLKEIVKDVQEPGGGGEASSGSPDASADAQSTPATTPDPAAAPTPAAAQIPASVSSHSADVVKYLNQMMEEVDLQLRLFKSFYLGKMALLVVPVLLLFFWEIFYVNSCHASRAPFIAPNQLSPGASANPTICAPPRPWTPESPWTSSPARPWAQGPANRPIPVPSKPPAMAARTFPNDLNFLGGRLLERDALLERCPAAD